MNKAEQLVLLAELETAHCALNHGKETKAEDYKAVDYIITSIGTRTEDHQEKSVRELVIPICRECAEALQGEEWTLLYCFECAASRWVFRALAKNRYRHHVLWLKGCPDCTKKFGGLYFNDFPQEGGHHLLSDDSMDEAA